ncbi:hypothetical protein AOLI_G00239040 [Acnodon oligacanthus]
MDVNLHVSLSQNALTSTPTQPSVGYIFDENIQLRLNKVVECRVLKDSLACFKSLLKVCSNTCKQYVQAKDIHLKREAIIKALCPHLNENEGFLIQEYMISQYVTSAHHHHSNSVLISN